MIFSSDQTKAWSAPTNVTSMTAGIEWGHGSLYYLFLAGVMFFIFARPVPAAAAYLSLNSGQAEKGGKVTFALTVNDAPNTVNAFMLDIEYDFNTLRFLDSAAGELAQGGYSLFKVFNRAPGVVRIGGVEPQSPGVQKGDSGTLVYVTFDVLTDNNCTLALTSLTNDVNNWTTQAGSFEALPTEPSSDEADEDAVDITAEENAASESSEEDNQTAAGQETSEQIANQNDSSGENTRVAPSSASDNEMSVTPLNSAENSANKDETDISSLIPGWLTIFAADGSGSGRETEAISGKAGEGVAPTEEAAESASRHNEKPLFNQGDAESPVGGAAKEESSVDLNNLRVNDKIVPRPVISGPVRSVAEQMEQAVAGKPGQKKQPTFLQPRKAALENRLNGLSLQFFGKETASEKAAVVQRGQQAMQPVARPLKGLMQIMDFMLQAAILLVLLLVLKEIKSLKIPPLSAAGNAPGSSENNSDADDRQRQSPSKIIRLSK